MDFPKVFLNHQAPKMLFLWYSQISKIKGAGALSLSTLGF